MMKLTCSKTAIREEIVEGSRMESRSNTAARLNSSAKKVVRNKSHADIYDDPREILTNNDVPGNNDVSSNKYEVSDRSVPPSHLWLR